MSEVRQIAEAAKRASVPLAQTSSTERNAALMAMAAALRAHADEILAANEEDMVLAREGGTGQGLLDRLLLTDVRLEAVAAALEEVAALPDPLGEVVSGRTLANGLEIKQVRVPLGVVGMIYEARPNVTADAASLCVKTGNAAILRGGSLATNSNVALVRVLSEAAVGAGMPANCIQLIESPDRAAATELMGMHDLVDVLIPRGGAGLIRSVVDNAKVPVIETGTGNCHIYLHASADPDMAENIVINAKTQRPSVCNAAESLIVDRSAAAALVPRILAELTRRGVVLHVTAEVAALTDLPGLVPATDEDFATEYHDLEMSVALVDGVAEAIDHINRYGTKHSESIVTSDYAASQRFLHEVDAAAVYVNASTRFTDGGVFGLGAEIGISTQKLHARGPMGLTALTSTKFMINGSGQVRE